MQDILIKTSCDCIVIRTVTLKQLFQDSSEGKYQLCSKYDCLLTEAYQPTIHLPGILNAFALKV